MSELVGWFGMFGLVSEFGLVGYHIRGWALVWIELLSEWYGVFVCLFGWLYCKVLFSILKYCLFGVISCLHCKVL